MRFEVLKLFAFLTCLGYVTADGFFTIIGSKLIRHKKQYHVSIISQGYDEPQNLEVAIRSSKKEEKRFEVAHNVTLFNGKTQKLEFDLKDQPVGDYSLEAKLLSGDQFEKVVKLNMNTKTHSVFVQTDKSIYKPADKVQFRILALNADMKPLKSNKVQVYITDGAQNRIKQFDNVAFNKGVFQSELQLSDSPVMGTWTIHVKVNNEKETTKDFEVAEYTLPKFEVTIDANPNANFKDGKIRATIRAKYTFGKIAKGNATVTAEVVNIRWWRQESENKVSKSVEVDGKKPVEFEIDEELGIKDKQGERTVKLFATFKEELTEREQNATASVTIHPTPHKIELEKSSQYFKPGLPFSVTAFVKYHDKDAPVSDPNNPLKFTITYFYDTLRTCKRRLYDYYYHRRNPNTDATYETYQCREEHSYKKDSEVVLSNGFFKLPIDVPSNTTRIDVVAKYLETEKTLSYIQRQESENNQYIQIRTPTKSPKISEVVEIEVLATESLSQLNYQVLGKGDVIVTEVLSVPNSKNFSFTFTPSLAMIPKANVIVFYITTDGEIISDSLKVEFGNELRNFVDIKLSTDQAKPGEQLEISVSSKPNSFVGLLGVDQSVLLLKKGNDIEPSTVFEELDKYNEVTKYNYEWYRDYDWRSYSDFQSSEAVIITNAKKEFTRPYIPIYYPHSYDYDNFGGSEDDSDGDRVYSLQSHKISEMRPESSFAGLSAGGLNARPVFQSAPAPVADRISGSSFNRVSDPAPVGTPQKPREIEIRKTFPETWMFDSFDFNDGTKNATLVKKVPDTITSWIITGFSVDPINGLGLTKQPLKFNVFQPFFVTTYLPYSIKRGEVVSIPILVFNYMDSDQETEVTLFNKEEEFEFTEVKEDENQVRRRKRATETQRKKNVLVKSQSGKSVSFMIRPLKVGHITIKVIATSEVAGDGLERQLIVEPEGVTQYMNKAVFIDLRSSTEFKSNISITIPQNAVPDSTKIEASAIADILGPSIENLDSLIKLPYGCGEQNMLNFVPNIVVLDYLTTLNKLTPEIETKAKTFMETGYQRELSYKHDDGSYSAFGKSDKSGSTWLTAFVAKSFNQASRYIMVDEEIVKQAFDFLTKVQTDDGSFPEVGHISHKDMQGGSSKGIALTAYTLITFLENEKLAKTYQDTIDKALSFIVSNINSLDDKYSLAIASYAFQLAKHTLKETLLSRLNDQSDNKNGMKHWHKEIPKSDESNPWSHRPNSVNVEMSAYGLQAFVEENRDAEAVTIMKWLVTQRNENGGFQSTQDTVVGLQALSKLATRIYVPNSKIDITLSHSGGEVNNLNVNAENALILQKHELPTYARDFEVTARGRGFSILQLSYKYNLNISGEWPRFVLEPEVHKNSNKEFLHLIVCTSFVPDDLNEKSNMAVMEVTFPSGYTYDTDTLPELQATENVKKIETKDGETIVIVYFDDLSSTKICPEFKAYRTHSVAKQKPAPIKIYDYYDNSRRARSFYNPPEISLCDICDGAEECKEDCEQMEINVV